MSTVTFPRRLARVAAAAVAAWLILPATAAVAATPDGASTATFVKYGYGYNGVINDHAASQMILKVDDGDSVEMFCIEEPKPFDEKATYSSAPRATATGVDNLGKVADLAVNSASKGTPLADPNAEATAVQLAIWKLANGTDYASVNNAAIRGRADALVAAATDRPEGHSSFKVVAAATLGTDDDPATEDKTVIISAKLTNGQGKPLPGEQLVITTPAGAKSLTTDGDGIVSLTVDAGAAEAKASVSYAGVLPAGTVFVAGTSQKIISTKAANITRAAEVVLPAMVSAVSTTVPTTNPPVTVDPNTDGVPTTADPQVTQAAPPETAPRPEKLPYTGTWIGLPAVLIVLAATGAGIVIRRKSRIR